MEGTTVSQHKVRIEPDSLICSGGLEAAIVRDNNDPQRHGKLRETKETKEAAAAGKYALLAVVNDRNCDSLYDKRLSCFGCGIGWFCCILGFIFPLLWYIATALYFGKYSLRDPRERAGLAASAIAALVCSFTALVTLLAFIL